MLSLLLAAAVASAAERVPIESLDWLAGCWSYDGREPGSVEHWLAPSGGAAGPLQRSGELGLGRW